eukprot:6690607-Pyramimonas_sp.AAC.1
MRRQCPKSQAGPVTGAWQRGHARCGRIKGLRRKGSEYYPAPRSRPPRDRRWGHQTRKPQCPV